MLSILTCPKVPRVRCGPRERSTQNWGLLGHFANNMIENQKAGTQSRWVFFLLNLREFVASSSGASYTKTTENQDKPLQSQKLSLSGGMSMSPVEVTPSGLSSLRSRHVSIPWCRCPDNTGEPLPNQQKQLTRMAGVHLSCFSSYFSRLK